MWKPKFILYPCQVQQWRHCPLCSHFSGVGHPHFNHWSKVLNGGKYQHLDTESYSCILLKQWLVTEQIWTKWMSCVTILINGLLQCYCMQASSTCCVFMGRLHNSHLCLIATCYHSSSLPSLWKQLSFSTQGREGVVKKDSISHSIKVW